MGRQTPNANRFRHRPSPATIARFALQSLTAIGRILIPDLDNDPPIPGFHQRMKTGEPFRDPSFLQLKAA